MEGGDYEMRTVKSIDLQTLILPHEPGYPSYSSVLRCNSRVFAAS